MKQFSTFYNDIKDLNWTDYCKRFHTETLYFTDKDESKLITVAEGSGDNLTNEDIDEGLKDYWYVEVYNNEGNIGGGMLLLPELIKETNMNIAETIKFIQDNKDAFDEVNLSDMNLIGVGKGEELLEHFEEIENAKYR